MLGSENTYFSFGFGSVRFGDVLFCFVFLFWEKREKALLLLAVRYDDNDDCIANNTTVGDFQRAEASKIPGWVDLIDRLRWLVVLSDPVDPFAHARVVGANERASDTVLSTRGAIASSPDPVLSFCNVLLDGYVCFYFFCTVCIYVYVCVPSIN